MASPSDPYVAALKMLASRELSEAQIRERLARRGYDSTAIDETVRRLRDERAIDDVRAAEAVVRTEVSVRRHGRRRVELHLERAGIDTETARRVVGEAFEALDEDAQIEAAIGRRLRGRPLIADDRELQRLYRYLVGQGFDAERVQTILAARTRPS